MAIDLDVHGNTKPLEAAVQAAINRIRRKPIKVTVDDKGATQPLGNMKRAADEFSKSMEAANARILAFGASMAIINGVADAFKGMVRNMVEVEKSMADINVVMGLSAQNLDKFGDGLFKVAKETGAAFRVAADAATEYARQGLSMEESLKRTRDALILTRLTGMDSAEAVKSLTAAMNTYGNQIKDTTQLVSKFAAVDVQFAVSAEDFAAAISRTGQAAKSAGVDIDELIGIVTSAQQQTARGGAVIGNALKTIFTKTGRTDTLNQLEDLGIAVRDLEGNTIGAKRILTDLANTFDKLSEAQKAQITQTMGGLFHINILKAVLSDAAKQNGILARATQISSSATDEAIQKNQQLRETMSAMATETGLAIKQVSTQIGELMLAPGMEKILNTVKSLAEGLSGVLGNGEGVGNKFATGFLKGVGNVITGPGLVVLTAVFFKLFGTALKFTKESLGSLIGITTEAQKQKAIQTSLVALIGQNAALGKEMLRTDISRTEKEKILLGLLRMQTAEAKELDRVSKSLASTLYTRGYGPGLTTGKRRAYGHIPNFADPERSQAARGGYAAGSIRTMNMPGEGSVIYNSAETVKNFAGFKQPAIMPPQSSKAGKNYQQAFGNIHGFDPYAAGGYIPNYAKSVEGSVINKDKKMVVFAASMDRGGKYAGINDDLNNIFSIKPQGGGFKLSSDPTAKGFSRVNVPYFGISKKDAQIDEHKDFQSLINGRLIKAGQKVAGEIATKILGKNYSVRDLKEGDVAAASGNIFEAAIMALQGGIAREAREKDPGGTALLDIPRAGRDKLWEVFGAEGFGGLGAEAKIALGGAGKIGSHLKSAAEKFYKIERKGKDPFAGRKTSTSKTSDLTKGILSNRGGRLFVGDEPWSSSNEKQAALLRGAGFKPLQSGKFSKVGLNNQLKAYGHIPNFADPLSDAIGREKAAGVPVSQIRVGSHSALMSKGNPLGLGVTNTHDEPNGLRDVFGANGFVPNYAADLFKASDIDPSHGNRKEREKLIKKINQELSKDLKQMPKNRRNQEKLGQRIEKLGQQYNLNESAVKRVTRANQTMGYRMTQGLRNMGQGNAGMAMMMGLPMAAGFLGGDDPTSKAGGGISGAMMGVATGASIGMMLPGFGTAIGAAVGGLVGFVSGLEKAEQASKDLAEAKQEERLKSLSNISGGNIGALVSSFNTASMQDAAEFFGGKSINIRSQSGIKGGVSIPMQKLFEGQKVESVIEDLRGGAFRAEGRLTEVVNKELIKESAMSMANDIDKALKEENKAKSVNLLNQIFKNPKARTTLSAITGGSITPMNISGDAKYTHAGVARGGYFGLTKSQQDFKHQMRQALSDGEFAQYASDSIKNETLFLAGEISQNIKSGGFVKNLSPDQMKMLAEGGVVGSSGLDYQGIANQQLTSQVLRSLYSNAPENMRFNAVTGFAKQNGKDVTLTQRMSPQKYAEFLESDRFKNLQEEEQQKVLESAKNALIDKVDAESDARTQMIDSIIRQVDLQKASLSAQDAFNKNMHETNNSFRVIANNYKVREQTLGAFMSQSQKNELNYNKELNAAAQKFVQARDTNKFQARQSLILSLKPFEQTLGNLGHTSESVSKMSYDELKELFKTLKQQGESGRVIRKIIDGNVQLLKNKNNEADRGLEIAKEEARIRKLIADLTLKQRTGPKAFQYGFAAEQTKMRESAAELDHQLGTIVATNFRDGLVSGMRAAINQAEDLGDVLQGVAMNFLQAIQNAYLTAAANQIVGAIPMPGISTPSTSTSWSFNRGGGVRRYNNGGNVAAMVSNGEYLMGRDAVSKYGGAFMHSLNAGGKIPGFSNGGAAGSALAANFGGGRAYESGRAYQSRAMSGFFYAKSGNVGLSEDTYALQGILADEERKRREAAAKKAKKKAFWKQLLGTALSAGIAYGVGGGFSKSGGLGSGPGGEVWQTGTPSSPGADLDMPDMSSIEAYAYRGGPIRRYASGGYISGKSGIDQIPAMLSEGEYVIRASSARQLGKPMLDRINAGKFNEGGAVSELMGSSETASSGGNTNNINISINMERGSGSKKENQSQDNSGQNPADRSSEEQNSAALADRIKQQVVAVIVEEQRPGGLLSE